MLHQILDQQPSTRAEGRQSISCNLPIGQKSSGERERWLVVLAVKPLLNMTWILLMLFPSDKATNKEGRKMTVSDYNNASRRVRAYFIHFF